MVIDHARLHHGEPLDRVDRENPVHPLEAHDHRAVQRVGPAGQPGPRPAGDHGHPVLDAEPYHGLHLRRGGGPDDGQGQRVRRPFRLVVGIPFQRVRVGGHAAGGQQLVQVLAYAVRERRGPFHEGRHRTLLIGAIAHAPSMTNTMPETNSTG